MSPTRVQSLSITFSLLSLKSTKCGVAETGTQHTFSLALTTPPESVGVVARILIGLDAISNSPRSPLLWPGGLLVFVLWTWDF